MKVKPIELTFDLAMSDPNRSKGLHVSEIYGSYYQETEPGRYRKDGKPPDLLMAIGLAVEQYLEKVLVANGMLCERPGELRSPEGIYFSPDLVMLPTADRLGEIKYTLMSSKVGPTHKKFAKYLTQGKIYCYWTGIPRIRYFVLHGMGDWNRRKPPMPVLNVWDVDFTARELRDEYKLLMNHARTTGLLDQLQGE